MRIAAPLFATASILVLAAALRPARQQSPLDGSQLRAGVDTLVASTDAGGQTVVIGWATQSYARSTAGSRAAWVQEYRWHGRRGDESVDSLVMDAATLRPIREVLLAAGDRTQIDYQGARVRAVHTPAEGAAARQDTTFATPVFASAAMEALARALPRSTGATAAFDLYYKFPSPLGIQHVRMTVTGTETVRLPSGSTVECLVVATSPEEGMSRFWIDRRTGELVQFSVREDGAVFWFRRLRDYPARSAMRPSSPDGRTAAGG